MVCYIQLIRDLSKTGKVASLPNDLFKAAVTIVQNLPKKGSFVISSDKRVLFYSFYKQATCGPCSTPSPSSWNIVAKFKWEAWKSLADMDSDLAQQKYVEMLKTVIDKAMEECNYVFLMDENNGDAENILRPNLELLGYDWRAMFSPPVKLGAASDNRIFRTDDSSMNEQTVSRNLSESFDSLSTYSQNDSAAFSKGCSDDDYDDATDMQDGMTITNERGNCLNELPKVVEPVASGSSSMEQEHREACKGLASLTLRLTGLMQVLIEQQKIFGSFVQNIRSRVDEPVMSWKIFIFLIIWPFVVNLLMKILPFIKHLF